MGASVLQFITIIIIVSFFGSFLWTTHSFGLDTIQKCLGMLGWVKSSEGTCKSDLGML
jgi:uncharacterized Tic20 family protein